MLETEHVQVAIVLMKRAPLKGDEAINVANTIEAFEALYDQMQRPLVKDQDDDTGTD